jgi:hypothetical protein
MKTKQAFTFAHVCKPLQKKANVCTTYTNTRMNRKKEKRNSHHFSPRCSLFNDDHAATVSHNGGKE